MSYQYHTADVFTDKAFGGNQLAVLPDARGLTAEQMAAITREFNFSETTFVFPPESSDNTRRIRIFTPGAEIPFAGHPTVGTAVVLASIGEIPLSGDETRIVFEEGIGPIQVLIRAKNGKPTFAQLTAAKVPEKADVSWDSAALASVLSLSESDIATDDGNAIEGWSAGLPYLYVPLRSMDALARSRINLELWERHLKGKWSAEPVVFYQVPGKSEVRCRMFAPGVGVPEDPATGSAAAAFAGYVASRAPKEKATVEVTIIQGVEMGRPSRLELEVDTSPSGVTAVRVGGASVLVSSGTLHVP